MSLWRVHVSLEWATISPSEQTTPLQQGTRAVFMPVWRTISGRHSDRQEINPDIVLFELLIHERVMDMLSRVFTPSLLHKAISSLLFLAILKFFVYSEVDFWQDKFVWFSVPVLSYPGADSRNIQLTAHCRETAKSISEFETCYSDADIVKKTFPQANVPSLNYPSIWADIYYVVFDSTETSFMRFWRLNAVALMSAILFHSFRSTPLLFPAIALSPPVLLAVERGNTDALTFFLLYVPTMIGLRSQAFNAFFLGLGAAAKLFPVFGFLAFLVLPFRNRPKPPLLGALLAAPLMIYGVYSVLGTLSDTTRGFYHSYGLLSLTYAPHLEARPSIAYAMIVLFVLIVSVYAVVAGRHDVYRVFFSELASKGSKDVYLAVTALLIFSGTFLVFVNWSYRLIFLLPMLFVFSTMKSPLATVLSLWMIFVFWLPLIPFGWGIQNLACFALFGLLSPILFRAFKEGFGKD